MGHPEVKVPTAESGAAAGNTNTVSSASRSSGSVEAAPRWPEARVRKFRQAAFVYLHVAILYEAAAYEMMRAGLLPGRFGPPIVWLLAGVVVAGVMFVGIYRWQHAGFVRVLWLVHGLRLPALIRGAFFAGAGARMVPTFYLTALVVIVINLWMLARAGWDL
jgi:hypothetical protein